VNSVGISESLPHARAEVKAPIDRELEQIAYFSRGIEHLQESGQCSSWLDLLRCCLFGCLQCELLRLCGRADVFGIVGCEQSIEFVTGKFSSVQCYFLFGSNEGLVGFRVPLRFFHCYLKSFGPCSRRGTKLCLRTSEFCVVSALAHRHQREADFTVNPCFAIAWIRAGSFPSGVTLDFASIGVSDCRFHDFVCSACACRIRFFAVCYWTEIKVRNRRLDVLCGNRQEVMQGATAHLI
jgi:hypothetical protein